MSHNTNTPEGSTTSQDTTSQDTTSQDTAKSGRERRFTTVQLLCTGIIAAATIIARHDLINLTVSIVVVIRSVVTLVYIGLITGLLCYAVSRPAVVTDKIRSYSTKTALRAKGKLLS